MKPTIFIGSSSESRYIAYALQEILENAGVCEPCVWDQDIFRPSKNALDSLIDTISEKDFAIFLFIPDDSLEKRGDKYSAIRDNVVFELGLFIGSLGRERCFVLEPKNCDNMASPSDLAGFTTLRFDANRSDNNLLASLAPASNKITREVLNLGKKGVSISNKPSGWPRYLDHDPSWNEVEDALSYFSEIINEFNPCVIVGVNRGGGILGNMLAKRTGIKLIYSVRTEGYRENDEQRIDKELLNRKEKPKRIFVIDDVTDTGVEIEEAKRLLKDAFPDALTAICVFLEIPIRTLNREEQTIDKVAYKSKIAIINPPWDSNRVTPTL